MPIPSYKFILKHKYGGRRFADIYTELEQALLQYKRIVDEMDSFKGTGDWVMRDGPGLTVVDGDEPFIGPMGNAMMAQVEIARSRMRFLVDGKWGNLPLIQQYYERIMQQPFPEDYQGHDIPAEYTTIDGKLLADGSQ